MSDLNSYSFAGRLAAEPELKYSQGGTAIWSGRVAVGYGYGDNKGTTWITIKALGKRAEAFGKWTLGKGQQVWGCGELQVRDFEARDGSKGRSVEVLIEQFGSAAQGEVQERPQRKAASDFKDDSFEDLPF